MFQYYYNFNPSTYMSKYSRIFKYRIGSPFAQHYDATQWVEYASFR